MIIFVQKNKGLGLDIPHFSGTLMSKLSVVGKTKGRLNVKLGRIRPKPAVYFKNTILSSLLI